MTEFDFLYIRLDHAGSRNDCFRFLTFQMAPEEVPRVVLSLRRLASVAWSQRIDNPGTVIRNTMQCVAAKYDKPIFILFSQQKSRSLNSVLESNEPFCHRELHDIYSFHLQLQSMSMPTQDLQRRCSVLIT